ncbi:hypothetical protein PG996_000243 [Apiospora saccharicola]|uniref:Uncharacterized protein n=1 Tax=Apiospora saccharicola TaxID=335842 RepID=A0ABR1WDD5_9PEZI
MESSGGDELRIWLRNNEEDLDWDQALELLDNVLDETKDTNQGADCIDAWMRWAVPRFGSEHISYGFGLAREYGLGDVYMVAWDDTEKGLDEMDVDSAAKTELMNRQEAMIKLQEGADGGEEGEERKQGIQEYACSDGGVDSAAEETKAEDQLLEG